MERKVTNNSVEFAMNRINNEIEIQESIYKDAIDKSNAIEKNMKSVINNHLNPIFTGLGENWNLDFQLERLEVSRVNETNSWNSFDVRYYGNHWVEFDDADQEKAQFYSKLEINFSSASGDDEATLERCIAQGLVASAILLHKEEILNILNEIHNEFSLEKTKANTIRYTAERQIDKLKKEKEELEMSVVIEKAKTTGVEFTTATDRWDNEVRPEFEVKAGREVDNIVSCKIVNITPTGKTMEVELTYAAYYYDTEAGCNRRCETDHKTNERVSADKVVRFLKKYKNQIRHSDES